MCWVCGCFAAISILVLPISGTERPVKMYCHSLNPENHTNYEIQIVVFAFKMHTNLPSPSSVCISKMLLAFLRCHSKGAVCAIPVTGLLKFL